MPVQAISRIAVTGGIIRWDNRGLAGLSGAHLADTVDFGAMAAVSVGQQQVFVTRTVRPQGLGGAREQIDYRHAAQCDIACLEADLVRGFAAEGDDDIQVRGSVGPLGPVR